MTTSPAGKAFMIMLSLLYQPAFHADSSFHDDAGAGSKPARRRAPRLRLSIFDVLGFLRPPRMGHTDTLPSAHGVTATPRVAEGASVI